MNTLLTSMAVKAWLKEYVAVSINICPWQNPMRLGIKLRPPRGVHEVHREEIRQDYCLNPSFPVDK